MTVVSTIMQQLSQRALAELTRRPTGPLVDTTLAALGPASAHAARVESLRRLGGEAAVFGMGRQLHRLPFSPALHLLESSDGPDRLARRWWRLQAAWGTAAPSEIRSAGPSAVILDCTPGGGEAAPALQRLMVCGAFVSLLRARGHRPIRVCGWEPASRRWRTLLWEDLWVAARAPVEALRFRIEWGGVRPRPARLHLLDPEDAAETTAARALPRIEAGLVDGLDPRAIARALDVSLRTLNRRLAVEGTTLGGLHRRVRLREACLRISGSDQSLTEIAHDLGFSDSAHLSRGFTAACGLSPRSYRQAAREG